MFVFLPLFVIAKICFYLQGPNTIFSYSLHNHKVHGCTKYGLDIGRPHLYLQILSSHCDCKEKASDAEESSTMEEIEK